MRAPLAAAAERTEALCVIAGAIDDTIFCCFFYATALLLRRACYAQDDDIAALHAFTCRHYSLRYATPRCLLIITPVASIRTEGTPL